MFRGLNANRNHRKTQFAMVTTKAKCGTEIFPFALQGH